VKEKHRGRLQTLRDASARHRAGGQAAATVTKAKPDNGTVP